MPPLFEGPEKRLPSDLFSCEGPPDKPVYRRYGAFRLKGRSLLSSQRGQEITGAGKGRDNGNPASRLYLQRAPSCNSSSSGGHRTVFHHQGLCAWCRAPGSDIPHCVIFPGGEARRRRRGARKRANLPALHTGRWVVPPGGGEGPKNLHYSGSRRRQSDEFGMRGTRRVAHPDNYSVKGVVRRRPCVPVPVGSTGFEGKPVLPSFDSGPVNR